MNDKNLNYISLQQITKYCPRTLSGVSVRGHFLSGENVRGHFFPGKMSVDTFSGKNVRGHFFQGKVSADTVSGFLDGAKIVIRMV